MGSQAASSAESSEFDGQLADLLAELAQRMQSGEQVDLDDYVHSHPEYAEQLQQFLPAMMTLADLGYTQSSVASSTAIAADASRQVSGELGDFQIIREVGRGGMGVVYEAEQISLKRQVALKVLPFVAVLDQKQLQRFKNEAQAAASLKHPNIVAIHSVGCERAVHFYAMDYIEGRTLAQVINELRQDSRPEPEAEQAGRFALDEKNDSSHDPTTEFKATPQPDASPSADTDRQVEAHVSTEGSHGTAEFSRSMARLVIQAAEALEHAHQMGVVHRDVKPSNLMVDTAGHLWVTDFGLAMTQTETNLTMTGDVLGTLRYMSPEQAEGKSPALDHRTDIYSLGVTLYELLTLKPAFGDDDRHKLVHQIIDGDLRSPRQLNPSIPRDLETIVLKAMATEPEGRYDTAQELADDLKRFLEHRPILARRISLPFRFSRWCKRNPMAATVAALLLFFALAGPLVGVNQTYLAASEANARRRADEETTRARAAARRERRARRQIRQHLYVADMNRIQTACERGDFAPANRLLQRHVPSAGDNDLREFTWHYWNRIANPEHVRLDATGKWNRMAASPDGNLLYCLCGDSMGERDDSVYVWEVKTGSLVKTIHHLPENPKSIDISPNSDLLAIGDGDGKVLIIDLSADDKRSVIKAHQQVRAANRYWGCRATVFSPDGHSIATGGGDRAVRLWDLGTCNRTAEFFCESRVWEVAFSPSGDAVAAVDAAKRLFVWNLASEELKFSQPVGAEAVAVKYSPNGEILATGETGGRISFWDAQTGRRIRTVDGKHAGHVWRISFSDDGRGLTSVGFDRLVKHWDVDSGRLLHTFGGHTGGIGDVVHVPGTSTVATSSADQTIRLWEMKPGGDYHQALRIDKKGVRFCSFAPDGRSFATAGGDQLTLWNTQDMSVLLTVGGLRNPVCSFAPNGKSFATAGGDQLTLWNTQDMSVLLTVEGLRNPGRIKSVSFSHDGKLLAAADGYGTITILRTDTGDVVETLSGHETRVSTVRFSPDSQILVWRGGDRSIRLWDAGTGKQKEVMQTDAVFFVTVEFVHGTNCLMASRGGLGLWDMDTGECRRRFKGVGFPWTVSSDGTRVAGELPSGEIALLGVDDGETIRTCLGRAASLEDLVFSPRDPILAGAYSDGLVAVWDLRTGDILSTFKALSRGHYRVAFAPDGESLLASVGDHLTMWRVNAEPRAYDAEPEKTDGEKRE